MPKSTPLTAPATPIALQAHHLLSPPPDRLTNTATTLSISHPQEDNPIHTFTIHRLRAHEPPDSPDRQVPLYTVCSKPWPNTARIICDTEDTPILLLRRIWLSGVRRWGVRIPGKPGDILEASMPWTGEGPGSKVGVGSGGFRLDVRFVNALRATRVALDEPPPYSALERNGNLPREKETSIPDSVSTSRPAEDSTLPSYASVRRDSPNELRDLLDAIEPPQEPAPASYSLAGSSACAPGSGIGACGSKVELKVLQLGVSGTSVMMGNHKIIHVTRHNFMDYSKSKPKSRPRWEAEVAEGVDLLLAVSIVLIMAESVSQNKWR
ncbi:hypothetical protein N7457_006888 [Penicillium paradoxum]|uniref:uncharacterized protein n=1 Tax=Penicillium paradoxum TaxID=176176 RepID=UPI0025472DE7|nr:uncharacterized protein N7457_006888 [Penicillium paradoxum]KAJ5779168.1 hypothetical protein N7457_006888 [Penicillium paradoxum]